MRAFSCKCGGFCPACWDREGTFYPVSEIDTTDIKRIETLFAGLVCRMLPEEAMISEELVENR